MFHLVSKSRPAAAILCAFAWAPFAPPQEPPKQEPPKQEQPKQEAPPAAPPAGETAVPPELADLVGTWQGEWSLFGVDPKGKVVARATWTDKLVAQAPTVEKSRAFVHTLDDMTFSGLGGKRQIQGTEGFFVDAKGAFGDTYLESGGRVTRLVRLADDVRAYSVAVDRSELQSLGLPADATGSHVLIRVTSKEDGHVMHRITRVTTVHWKDAEMNDRALQFTSLQGFHRRD